MKGYGAEAIFDVDMLNSGKKKSADSGEPPSSVHAYGRAAAVCLSRTTNRSGEPAVAVEFALARASSGYSWADKAVFQWTRNEIAEATAFFWIAWERLEWTHGRGGALKQLVLEKQGHRVLSTLRCGPQHWRVPLAPADQYSFRNFLISELLSQQPGLPVEFHLRSLRMLAEQLSSQSDA